MRTRYHTIPHVVGEDSPTPLSRLAELQALFELAGKFESRRALSEGQYLPTRVVVEEFSPKDSKLYCLYYKSQFFKVSMDGQKGLVFVYPLSGNR